MDLIKNCFNSISALYHRIKSATFFSLLLFTYEFVLNQSNYTMRWNNNEIETRPERLFHKLLQINQQIFFFIDLPLLYIGPLNNTWMNGIIKF